MKKSIQLLTLLFLLMLLFSGCGLFNKYEQTNNDHENNSEVTANDNNNEKNKSELTFADKVTVLKAEEVLVDQEIVDIDDNELIIEYEGVNYLEYEIVSELLDYEVKFDPDTSIAEIKEGKEDAVYEANHQEDGGALLDVGELYVETNDSYIDPSSEESFDFIEFNEKLYIPERVLELGFHTPINYVKDEQRLEIGERSEPLYLDEVETDGTTLLGDSGITTESKYTTIQGEDYDVVIFSNEASTKEYLTVETDYKHSLMTGVFYNNHDKDLEFVITTEDDELIRKEVNAGQVEEYEIDVRGTGEVEINIDTVSNALVQDSFSYTIHAELY